MKLLLDIGNTNVKWAWHDAHLSGFGEQAHAGMQAADIVASIEATDRSPDSIWISSVVEPVAGSVADALAERFGVRPAPVAVEREAHGIRVGYRHVERLGVDRWLAMIAARAGSAGAFCVADAGTACTIDGVLDDGLHLGGAISPGVAMMEHALLQRTADIANHAVEHPAGVALFADDTAAAVHAGALHSLAGLIERAAGELDDITGDRVSLFVTGGGASIIAPLIRRDVHVLRELVLRGLVIVATEHRTQ